MSEPSEIVAEKTKTKIIIRKYFLIIAVAIGVVAAMSQLFFDINSETVIEKRKEQRSARKIRDNKRVEAVNMLSEINAMDILPDSISQKVSYLVLQHKSAENSSKVLYDELVNLKNGERVRNFKNWNAFFGSIGNPILILITGILFIILYFFRRVLDWQKISKAFVYLSLMYLFVASVYLIWAFSNSLEIHKVYYIVGLVFAGIFATLGIRSLVRYLFHFSHTGEEKYKNVIRLLFQQILHDIPKRGFIKEEKMNEFTESNTEIINKVYKEVD